MKKTVVYQPYNYGLTVYLSSWFPLFGQGIFIGFSTAFVKYVFFTDNGKVTDTICWTETNDVIKHEYGHLVSRKQRGFFNFWGNIIWDYIRFWIPHNLKLMEIEANDIKLGLK